MKYLTIVLVYLMCSAAAPAADRSSEHAQKTLAIYRAIVEMDSSKKSGNVTAVANYLAAELRQAGFPKKDVEVVSVGEAAALIAHYRGDGSTNKKPILLLGHMDVVEAYAKDWQRPPFKLTQDETNFYARGSLDNKFGVAQLTSTFIRLKTAGWTPDRDLIIAFSGDEETEMQTTRYLANKRPDLRTAEYALNSDAGGGSLNDEGKAIVYSIQAAEKTYATWEVTARNAGGHSSLPRADNAIYDLADAIKKIQAQQFPVRWNDMTLAYFKVTGEQLGGELGKAMLRFAKDPADQEAATRLATEPSYVGTTRTTCVVTMLQGGHAENALPQSATATVNCRIFPGVSVRKIESRLQEVVGNKNIEFRLLGDPVESPVSELREEVVAAVKKAVHQRYPDVPVIGYMASGGTDGMHFRNAGIPTLAITGVFMNPNEKFAHGLNERVPLEAFYGALDHWSIILQQLAGKAAR